MSCGNSCGRSCWAEGWTRVAASPNNNNIIRLIFIQIIECNDIIHNALQVRGPFKCNPVGDGDVSFSREKRYAGVRFNVISITRGWVGVKCPGKKRYVTLKCPLCSTFMICRILSLFTCSCPQLAHSHFKKYLFRVAHSVN